MKKIITSVILLLSVAVFYANCQTDSGQKQSEKPLFEIVEVSVPDSIEFKLVKGKQIEFVLSVYLVSGKQTVRGETHAFKALRFIDNKSFLYDATILKTYFKVPAGFTATKIKFEADNRVLYYDIEKKEWD